MILHTAGRADRGKYPARCVAGDSKRLGGAPHYPIVVPPLPWYDHADPPQIVVLDEKATNLWPLSADEFKSALLNLQMDPAVNILREQDGYFVFGSSDGASQPAQPISVTWSSTLNLYGFDLAQSKGNRAFESLAGNIEAGSRLRVGLYWTALKPMPSHLAISVRLLGPDGSLVAQDDSWLARGALPTPLWEVGRSIRDTHYLDLSGVTLPPQLTLSVIVYDAASLEPLAPVEGYPLAALRAGNATQ